jgi:hypothetical protein
MPFRQVETLPLFAQHEWRLLECRVFPEPRKTPRQHSQFETLVSCISMEETELKTIFMKYLALPRTMAFLQAHPSETG